MSVEAGADPGFIFLQNTSCIRKPGHLRVWGGGGGGAPSAPPAPPPRSAPEKVYGRGIFSVKNGIYKGMGLDLGAEPLRIKLRSVPPGSSDGQN